MCDAINVNIGEVDLTTVYKDMDDVFVVPHVIISEERHFKSSLTLRPEFASPISNPANTPQVTSTLGLNAFLLEVRMRPLLIVRSARDANAWVNSDNDAEKRGNSKPYLFLSCSHLMYSVVDVDAVYHIIRLRFRVSRIVLQK